MALNSFSSKKLIAAGSYLVDSSKIEFQKPVVVPSHLKNPEPYLLPAANLHHNLFKHLSCFSRKSFPYVIDQEISCECLSEDF